MYWLLYYTFKQAVLINAAQPQATWQRRKLWTVRHQWWCLRVPASAANANLPQIAATSTQWWGGPLDLVQHQMFSSHASLSTVWVCNRNTANVRTNKKPSCCWRTTRACCKLQSGKMLHKCSMDCTWKGPQQGNDLQGHSRSLTLCTKFEDCSFKHPEDISWGVKF